MLTSNNSYKEKYQELLDIENAKHRCEKCLLAKIEKVPGNGITEPPYLTLARCPFDKEYYHALDDECAFPEKCEQHGGYLPANKIVLNVNNGYQLYVGQKEDDGKITVVSVSAEGKVDTSNGYPYDISAGDMVMLLNYYRYVKDNDIQCSFLNPGGHSTRCD